jgi:calcineurin-like phosphoesterase family protein
MGNIYIISDLHLGHEKMANLRGFNSSIEHDLYLKNCWNSIVNKGDTTWILGDISMEKKIFYKTLSELNGIKKVVLGNHDMPKPSHNLELLKYVNSIGGVVTDRENRYIMTHVPVHESELNRYRINIHGHLHEDLINDPRYVNVSCEQVNYTPVLLNDILDLHNLML